MFLNINPKIESKLEEFQKIGKAGNKYWFSELCFCILTANSKAITALNIQEELQASGFFKKTLDELKTIIKKHGHRFYNRKAEYIIQARKYKNIKDLLKSKKSQEAREFLANNIKGIGYKEASHFLRNVGYNDLAIIDRHILRFLYQEKLINSIPKIINKNNYLKYENILKRYNIPLSKLDLIIWEKMTGKILK